MSVSLAKGANVSLSKEAPGLSAVTVGLGWDLRTTTGADFDLDASAILCGADGKVRSDKDFVFFNNLVFPVSIYEGSARRQSFGQVRNAFIRVVNQTGGAELARYDLSEDASTAAALVFGELYRSGEDWKFRAVGEGYASGLSTMAAEFGVRL